MLTKFKEINSDILLAYFIGFAYSFGILNFYHLYPSKRNLNIGLEVCIIVSIGLLFVLSSRKFHFKQLGVSLLIWLTLIALLLLQPFLNHLAYPDSLIFPIASLIFISILSLSIFQVLDKEKFVSILSWFISISAILLSFTQLAQLLQWTFLFDVLVYPVPEGGRPVSNVVQPNQAAFVYAMGIASIIYLQLSLKTYSKSYRLCFFSAILFLAAAIGICGSRGGLILGVFSVLGYFFVSFRSIRKKIVSISLSCVLLFLGFFIGAFLLNKFSHTQTAVERLQNSGSSLRLFQQEQAWLIFNDHVITGIGWGNFSTSIFDYHSHLSWVSMTDHSHFIISQIASELGLLGLLVFIPFIWIIFKQFSFSLSCEKSYVLVVLGLFTLYSFSEYPLWYFTYLLLFSTFLSLLDIKLMNISLNIKKLFLVILSVLVIGSVYYRLAFKKYSDTFISLYFSDYAPAQKEIIVSNLSTPFGFLQFKEYMLFESMEVSSNKLEARLDIGERIVPLYPSSNFLEKQSYLYALNHNYEQSLKLLKIACLSDFSSQCDKVEENFQLAYESQPLYYQKSYQQFILWREQNPERTKLNMIK